MVARHATEAAAQRAAERDWEHAREVNTTVLRNATHRGDDGTVAPGASQETFRATRSTCGRFEDGRLVLVTSAQVGLRWRTLTCAGAGRPALAHARHAGNHVRRRTWSDGGEESPIYQQRCAGAPATVGGLALARLAARLHVRQRNTAKHPLFQRTLTCAGESQVRWRTCRCAGAGVGALKRRRLFLAHLDLRWRTCKCAGACAGALAHVQAFQRRSRCAGAGRKKLTCAGAHPPCARSSKVTTSGGARASRSYRRRQA